MTWGPRRMGSGIKRVRKGGGSPPDGSTPADVRYLDRKRSAAIGKVGAKLLLIQGVGGELLAKSRRHVATRDRWRHAERNVEHAAAVHMVALGCAHDQGMGRGSACGGRIHRLGMGTL